MKCDMYMTPEGKMYTLLSRQSTTGNLFFCYIGIRGTVPLLVSMTIVMLKLMVLSISMFVDYSS